MMDHLNQMDTQESTVKVDLLHLDPTGPDGGCCCGHHSGGHCCGRHRHGQENQPTTTSWARTSGVLLLETLRVLKKGGVFALNDDMKPRMYGDMEEFARELRDMGYEDVRLIDTAAEAFGSRRWAAMMMLDNSRMLVGRQ